MTDDSVALISDADHPRSLLLADDDAALRERLARALEMRGFHVVLADSVAMAADLIRRQPPRYAVVDLRLGDGSGLEIVQLLQRQRREARAIILTGYGNIATAVAAVKSGAIDYLAKPTDADSIVRALLSNGAGPPPVPDNPMSADRVKWEHIQRVFEASGRNVSETARRLNMHRRTLQRILGKYAPREQVDE